MHLPKVSRSLQFEYGLNMQFLGSRFFLLSDFNEILLILLRLFGEDTRK